MKSAIKIISAFRLEEDGVALTEYLILLGLLKRVAQKWAPILR